MMGRPDPSGRLNHRQSPKSLHETEEKKLKKIIMTQKRRATAQEYFDRQSRRSHPDGSFDKSGRWYPSEAEECECCKSIRSPSRSYPYSYMTHCRSVEHVANLFGQDPKIIRAIVKRFRAEEKAKDEENAKAVKHLSKFLGLSLRG